MIVLITTLDYKYIDNYGFGYGPKILYVSHGIDLSTDTVVILPCEPLLYYIKQNNVNYNEQIQEWVLE